MDLYTPRKIVFVIPALTSGGAERVMTRILQYMDRKRANVHLLLFREMGAYLNDVPPDVTIDTLVNSKHYYILRWTIYFKYKRYISVLKPDVVVSFMWYPNFVVLLEKWIGRGRHKVIVSERTTLAFTRGSRLVGWLRRCGTRLLYPKADRIIALTKQMRQELMSAAPIRPDRVKVIYNPVDLERLKIKAEEPVHHTWFDPSRPLILSIGRLTIEKGFKHLIGAFGQVIERNAPYLVVLGEGNERASLEGLIKRLDLKDRVHLPGYEKNPFKYLSQCTLFILSSINEGFPNVLIEAMALGVPCIATRCATGPEEIITDGVDGVLVPPADEASLADAITRLIQNEGLRKRMGEAAKKKAKEFRVGDIVTQYEDIMDEVCAASVRNNI